MEFQVLDRDLDGEEFRDVSYADFSILRQDYGVKVYVLICSPYLEYPSEVLKPFGDFIIEHIWAEEGFTYIIPIAAFHYDPRRKIDAHKGKLFKSNILPIYAERFDLNARIINRETEYEENYTHISKYELGHISTKEQLSEFILLYESASYFTSSILIKGIHEDKLNLDFIKNIYAKTNKYNSTLNFDYFDEVFTPGLTTTYTFHGYIDEGFVYVTEISRKK